MINDNGQLANGMYELSKGQNSRIGTVKHVAPIFNEVVITFLLLSMTLDGATFANNVSRTLTELSVAY